MSGSPRKRASVQDFRSKIEAAHGFQQLFLPRDEYALVMSELNSNMSDEDRKSRFIAKPIGNYIYLALNYGFDDYIIIGKFAIDDDVQDILEKLQ